MSYDLNLYLKSAPVLTPEAFAKTCKLFGLTGELAPDFSLDGNVSPLSVKLSGFLDGDEKSYLSAIDYSLSRQPITEPIVLAHPKKKKWWQFRLPVCPTFEVEEGSYVLTFSCGIDSLEVPAALLIAYALAGENGLLEDLQQSEICGFIGQPEIEGQVRSALNKLRATPADRLYLHEFDEWI